MRSHLTTKKFQKKYFIVWNMCSDGQPLFDLKVWMINVQGKSILVFGAKASLFIIDPIIPAAFWLHDLSLS